MDIREESWTDVRDSDVNVAALPVGATEQHGPHAPLCTDSIFAKEMARAATERTGTYLLPPIEVGVSKHHREYDGTLFLSPDTLRMVLTDVLSSIARHGIDRVVVVNGHGGNSAAIDEVCTELYQERVVFATSWVWIQNRDDQVNHAGRHETSMVMHLRPDLVDEPDKGDADMWGEFAEGSMVAYDTHEFSENGATGDPRDASPEEGEELFEESVAELVDLIKWFQNNPPGWE